MDFEHILDNLYLHLNDCRMRPHQASHHLQSLRPAYNGNLFKNKVKTREGVAALDNLIQDLQHRPEHNNRLKWSFALHLAADEQASVLGEEGILTTEGTRFHRSLPDRLKDYAIVKGRLTEVYEFGGNNANEILEELLIDDGLISRKRRNTLLDPIFNYIGVGTSYHEKTGACTVIILAEDIISLVAPEQTGKYKKRKVYEPGQQRIFRKYEQRDINPHQNRDYERERQAQRYHDNDSLSAEERVRREYITGERQSLFVLQPSQWNERRNYHDESGVNRVTAQSNQYDPNRQQSIYRPEQHHEEVNYTRQEEEKKKDEKSCVIM